MKVLIRHEHVFTLQDMSGVKQFVWDLERCGVADIDIPMLVLGGKHERLRRANQRFHLMASPHRDPSQVKCGLLARFCSAHLVIL